jgi:hypothetical protein
MGAEGPPTNEAPPPRDAPPLRLGGLTPGELEVSDGRFRISATFGQDGRVAGGDRAQAGAARPHARVRKRGNPSFFA